MADLGPKLMFVFYPKLRLTLHYETLWKTLLRKDSKLMQNDYWKTR